MDLIDAEDLIRPSSFYNRGGVLREPIQRRTGGGAMEVSSGGVFSQQFHWSGMWKDRISWRGVRCQKCPLDLWSYQQIVQLTLPEAVIECGVAFGGTTLFLADVLDLIGNGRVFGVEWDYRWLDPRVKGHHRITLIEGSTVQMETVRQVREAVEGLRTMVILDSDHSTAHVANELRTYCEFVTPGCYLICEDGNLDRADAPVIQSYPGPSAAIRAFLEERPDYAPQDSCVLGSTFNPGGYLLRV
jgi:cephalosporin hydroxylase